MAPPALLDGRHRPSCSCGCLGCCYGCRGPPKLSKWAVGDMVGKRSTVPCRPHHRHHLPPPSLRSHPAPQHWALTQGRMEDSWTGCCQRRGLSTDVRSTPSSERGSSRDFLPDTRFTGERGLHPFLCVCVGGESVCHATA